MTSEMMSQSSSEISSSQLLEQARAGDAASLEALLATYIGYLKVLSQSQLDVRLKRRVTSSDLVQETLLRAHRDFPQFAGVTTAEFTGWLRKILIHHAAREVESHLLAAKRDVRREAAVDQRNASPDESRLSVLAMLSDQGRSPASEMEYQEAMGKVASAIARLPTEYRTVIELRHLEGLAFDAVAERMQRSTGATRMLWLRAIQRLRESMQ